MQPHPKLSPGQVVSGSHAVLCLWMLALLPSCRLESEPAGSPSRNDLQGRVLLSGEIDLQPTIVKNTTDPEVCGISQSLEDVVLGGEDRALGNVIVALLDVPPEKVPTVAPQTLTLDNLDCRFVPHASVLTVGSTIEATNSDAVLHTTHLYGPAEMNFSLPVLGAKSSRTLNRPGLYSVKCDVHGWMQAFIRVSEHPFQAVTDSQGMFHIRDVPPGTYTLELWHERLGRMERRVEVSDAARSPIEILFGQEVSP